MKYAGKKISAKEVQFDFRHNSDTGDYNFFLMFYPNNTISCKAIAKPVEFVKYVYKEDKEDKECTFSLTRERMQRLMDDLWNDGFRPTGENIKENNTDIENNSYEKGVFLAEPPQVIIDREYVKKLEILNKQQEQIINSLTAVIDKITNPLVKLN